MKFRSLLLSTIAASFLLAGCGGGGGGSESSQSETSASKTPTLAADMNATITGSVFFQGDAPTRRPVRQDNDCKVLHTGDAPLTQSTVVNSNGTFKWAFVYVKEGLGDRKFDTPGTAVTFDQKGCLYEPHVFGVQTGQTIKILNSDPLLHNIHALPQDNRPFNFGMPKQGDVRERSFPKSEVMVKIKCDVHPWMSAYCGVLDHPYYSTTGDDGTFTIKNLPPGNYVIEAWHEVYGTMTQNVTVGANETKTADFTYTGKAS